VRLGFDRPTAGQLLRYGLPFQLQGIANQLGGWVTPLLVGVMIGPHAVGLLGWASANARKPLMIVDSVMRVAFPHFSRLQDDRAEVERMIRRYLAYLLLAAGLWCVLIAVAAPTLVPVVFTDKWSPAVPALILFAAAMAGDLVCWVLGVSLNALGLVGRVTRASVLRGLAYVGVALILVFPVGYNGVAIAALACSVVTVPYLLRGFGPGAFSRLLRPVTWVLLPVGAAATAGYAVWLVPLANVVSGILAGTAAALAFGTVVCRTRGRGLAARIRKRLVPAASISE
jgi:PST family polysaccharide transporter